MKKKLVAVMLATVLTMCACASTPSNVAENTETPISTEAMVQVETEISTEKVAESTEEAVFKTEVATETVETTEIAEETETAEPEFAVVAMEATKYAKSSVNVRKGPSSDYEKIGSLSTNQKVKVIGQADTGWYQIELDGEVAYVSNNYLVDEKVAVVKKESSKAPSTPVADNASDNVAVGTGSSDNGSVSTPSAPVEPTPSEPVEDNDGANEDDGWGNLTEGGTIGPEDGAPATDGYGPGVEIEITPTP